MKPTINERLNEVLGLEAESESPAPLPPPPPPANYTSTGNPDDDMKNDYDFIRKTLYGLVEKGSELVDNANFFAKEKQDARSVESAAIAQKTALESTMALIDLHKTRKEIERVSSQAPTGDTNNTVNATVFVGTTGELLKLTKEMNNGGALTDALKTITIDMPLEIEAPQQPALNSGAEPLK